MTHIICAAPAPPRGRRSTSKRCKECLFEQSGCFCHFERSAAESRNLIRNSSEVTDSSTALGMTIQCAKRTGGAKVVISSGAQRSREILVSHSCDEKDSSTALGMTIQCAKRTDYPQCESRKKNGARRSGKRLRQVCYVKPAQASRAAQHLKEVHKTYSINKSHNISYGIYYTDSADAD